MAFQPPTIQRFNTQPVATQSRSRLPRALAKGFRAGETQVPDFLVPAASPSKRELLQLLNDRAQLPGEVLGAAGMGGTTSEPGRGPRSRVPAPACPAPPVTFQPHELVVALLAQLQLPAVLAQQLLVAAVDLLDGLADLVGDVQRRQGPAPRPPGARQAALGALPPPCAESWTCAVTRRIFPVTPPGRFCYQSHFTEKETESQRG